MREIWRHRETGRRYLVEVRHGRADVAFGPLAAGDDPLAALSGRSAPPDALWALLHMRDAPGEYAREYTTDRAGHPVRLADEPQVD